MNIKELPLPGETFTVNTQPAFIIASAIDIADGDKSWVWYAPTLPGLPGKEECWMFRQFINAGITIASIDAGESYGSPAGCNLYTEFYNEIVTRGMSKKPALLARSRGGLMLYNWAVTNANSVSCIAGIYPVCNLKSYPGLKTACTAYGITEEELNTKLPDYNPINRIKSLALARVPIYHIHGDNDAVVPIEDNSAELAREYQQYGGNIKLNIIKNGGHDMWPGWFECQELVDFVIEGVTGVRE